MLLANAQSLRNQKTRERAEEGIETKEINDPRTKNLDVYPVLLAPSVLLDMQSTRIHNIPGLMSPQALLEEKTSRCKEKSEKIAQGLV